VINTNNNQTPATGGPGQTTAPGGDANAQRRQELRQAAQAFEAVFIRQLLGSMRSAKLADDMMGSQATDQFRDMADSRLADTMSQRGTFGIADMLVAQFQRHQSVQQAGANAGAGTATEAGAGPGTTRNGNEVTR
jgi:flagellar protein FlgJ